MLHTLTFTMCIAPFIALAIPHEHWSGLVYFINNISVKNHNTVIRYHNFVLFVIVNFTLYRRRSRRRMSEEQEEEEEEEEE